MAVIEKKTSAVTKKRDTTLSGSLLDKSLRVPLQGIVMPYNGMNAINV